MRNMCGRLSFSYEKSVNKYTGVIVYGALYALYIQRSKIVKLLEFSAISQVLYIKIYCIIYVI